MYSMVFARHAELLKALAHPRRLEIIHLLRDQKLPVTDIYTMLDLPQANISQHLGILRDAGIVTTEKKGKNIYYQLASQRFIAASDLIREEVIAEWNEHNPETCPAEMRYSLQELVPLVQDPVCHMRVSPKTASATSKYKNKSYYFCASGCYKLFIEDPEKYV